MKTIKFKTAAAIVFFIGSHSLFSQIGYSPFPEKHGRWLIITTKFANEPNPVRSMRLYETGGDTLLGGFVYKKIFSSKEMAMVPFPSEEEMWKYNYGPKALTFAYRNDIPSKKVYILTDTGGLITGHLKKEYVWYDFDLKIGDTLKSTYAIKWNTSTVEYSRIIILKTDSLFLCGNYHKRMDFKCSGYRDKLIEGIGFDGNFIETGTTCLFEPTTTYVTRFSCSPTSIPDEQKSPPSISIYPNPAVDALQLKWPQQTQQTSVYFSILDCLGRVVFQNTCNGESINISSLTSGLYFITVNDKAGNYYKNKFIKQ